MSEPPATLVVCDAGPLIHLDQLGCLDLLNDFSRVVVPDVVWREVQHYRPAAFIQNVVRFERLSPTREPSPQLTSLHLALRLHAGEMQALQIADELNAGVMLTDDAAARLAARAIKIDAHGTLGILMRAIRRKQRTRQEILDVLHGLPQQSTLHIKRVLLDEIIRRVQDLS